MWPWRHASTGTASASPMPASRFIRWPSTAAGSIRWKSSERSLVSPGFIVARLPISSITSRSSRCMYGSLAARIAGIRGIVNALAGLGYVFSSVGLRARMLRWIVKPVLKFALGRQKCRSDRPEQRRSGAGSLSTDWQMPAPSGSFAARASIPAPIARSRLPATTPLVILPARLLREKGVGEFVEAARLLRAQRRQGAFRAGREARSGKSGQREPGRNRCLGRRGGRRILGLAGRHAGRICAGADRLPADLS